MIKNWLRTFFVCSLVSASPAGAQYTTGRVEGTVFDQTGATAQGAKVTLTSPATNTSRSYDTDSSGLFAFAAVVPGIYSLSVEKSGFAGETAQIQVFSSQATTRNFTLQLGEQVTRLEVSADGAEQTMAAEPLRSSTHNTVNLDNLPNLSRNIVNVVVLAPGVTPTFHPRGGSLTTLSIAQAGQLNANGGRSKASAHQLDFTDANDWEFGGIALATQPAPEMMQEVRLLTSNWPAEYGVKASAQVVMITRSGSNALHGAAYDYLQNASLNARDLLDRTGKATPLRQNYFGVSAGGPVMKDRTFFQAGYEGRRTRGAGTTTIAALPTQAARDRVTDPSIRAILPLLPVPTAPTANPLIGTSAVLSSSPSDADLVLARGDHYFAPNHSLALRYFQNVATAFNRTPGSLPGFDATFDPIGRNAMLAHTYLPSPRATNELRLSYGRSSTLFSPETEPATPRYNVTGLVGFGTVQFWPQGRIFNVYQINDVFSLVRGRHVIKAGVDLRHIQDNSINDSSRRGIYTFASVDAFVAGTPSLFSQVFGNTYRGFRMNYHGAFVQDDWKLTPSLTLNLGLRWEFQGGLSEANRLQSVLDPTRPGAIGQAGTGPLGSFRNESPVVEGNPALFAPRVGFAWNPGSGRTVVRGGYGIYYDSFLFNGLQAGRTTPPTNYSGSLAGAQIQGANSLANLLAGASQFQRDLNAQVGGFGQLSNLGSITSMLPYLRNPYMQHFSLGVERRITGTLVADAAYVGTKGTALTIIGPGNSVRNRPRPAGSVEDELARLAEFRTAFSRINGPGNTRLDPRFDQVSLITDSGSSTYHSLQAGVRQSYSHGLQMQASYTWSKSIDNGSDYSPGQATTDRSYAQDIFNLANERAVSAFDIRHRFILSHVWQIPAFRDRRGVAGAALGGWTFASINQFQTGIPYTVLTGPRLGISDVNMDGELVSGLDNARASCVAGAADFRFGETSVPPPAQRGVDGTPNSANFKYVQPLLGNNGTCGRNSERMRALLNFDWTLSKEFRLFERGPAGSGPWGLEFRTDFFNIFNIPFRTASGDNFRNLASPSFGQFDAAAPSRRIQMALRLTW